jgi:hypothetical protein
MADTYCKICAFNNEANECYFDIPGYLDKEIEQRDGYRLIKNYRCLYGTSKESISDSSTVQDLANYALAKNHIRYYLSINMTELDYDTNSISYIINILNNLDIKPKFVSFLLRIKLGSHEIAQKIQDSLDPQIKWKMNNFLGNDTVNHCTYVNIATNMNANGSNCIIFFKPDNSDNDKRLNNRINFIQFSQLVKQENAHVIVESLDYLNGMCMPFPLYKDFVDNSDRDIVLGIKKVLDKNEPLKVLFYDYESHSKN